MKKSVWDIFAPIYERAMKSQKHIYDFMYAEISSAVKGKSVLELATGPGMIARHIAPSASSVIATDFSPKMIETAQKKTAAENVTFEVADATDLRFSDKSFDAVIIANALHVMPNPEKALAEIKRVLKDDGILIAPNFIVREHSKKNAWQKLLSLVGVRFNHDWTAEEYKAFLLENGWRAMKSQIVSGRIDLLYAECAFLENENRTGERI
ncbi:MAG: class I SAM-dependent methyltransferase [Treponema sp.]|nr:class I SAM-dependent methyltransferase [Treponema sp.]